MGICLDTEKKDEPEELEYIDGNPIWFVDGRHNRVKPEETSFSTQNEGHVKFESPKIPVIFVLGGPGSGKVTHCDNLAEEKRGIIHINMTDLLQQYSTSNGEMKDSNQLPSRTVAEVLMLEIKMSPAAKTFLISGYPRNMRDVVEYSEKIKAVSGVILLAWKQNSLERQIEYGAKLGHVILSLARMELNNFFKHVIPVADFYDQRKLLISINGERNPAEVYNDFRVAVLRIIGSQDTDVTVKSKIPNGKIVTSQPKSGGPSQTAAATPTTTTATVSVHKPPARGYPSVIYVIGGPGSNKAPLIQTVLRRIPGWAHISTGGLLRDKVGSTDWSLEKAQALRDTIAAGEMVEKQIVNEVLDEAMLRNINAHGLILDGYPRDLDELHDFEERYEQHPAIILLDCSKLQLSRGRWDDSIAAFRKRLEIFREKTLPMLKVLDTEHRLTMVDGDTDTPEVQEAFTIALFEAIQHVQEDSEGDHGSNGQPNTKINFEEAILQDLEDEALDTNHQKIQMNGYGPPRDHRGVLRSGNNVVSVSHAHAEQQGPFLPQENTIKTHAQVESYPKNKYT